MKKNFKFFYFFILLIFKVKSEENVFELLSIGQNNFTITDKNHAILVLGNIECGKSTLVHYLTKDANRIRVIEANETNLQIIDDWNVSNKTHLLPFVPEILLDDQNNVWYNCPGFQDTRIPELEIANTYFMKSLTVRIENFKIVLTLNYDALRNSNEFTNLVKFTLNFLKNIEKFDISLVLTKTDSIQINLNRIIPITEKMIIDETVEFLNRYIENISSTRDSQLVEKNQLIDKLLHQTNGIFDRIGIFYKPTNVGTFANITNMAEGKEKLLRLIRDQMNYSKVDSNDFGYSLTIEAENLYSVLRHNISQEIIKTLNYIDFVMSQELLQQSVENYKMILFNNSLAKLRSNFMHSSYGTLNELTNFIRELSDSKINLSEEDLDNVSTHQRYINFLNTIQKRNDSDLDLYENFQFPNTYHTLIDMINWNTFFDKMKEKLTSYDIQQDITLYNVGNLSDWGIKNRPQNLLIENNNIDKFFILIESPIPTELNITMNEIRFNMINTFIKSVFQSEMNVECHEDVLLCEGPIIFLSHIDLKQCFNISKIHIYASEVFFADQSVDFRHLKRLTIAAKRFEVVNDIKIDLRGHDNTYKHSPNRNGTFDHPDVISGKPGLPGVNGGDFCANAKKLLNGQRLTIDISGGKGGRGQDGSQAYFEISELDKIQLENFRKCNIKTALINATYSYRHINGDELPSCCDRSFYYGTKSNSIKITSHQYVLHPRQCCQENGKAGIGNSFIFIIQTN